MWRTTGAEVWRDRAWEIFLAIEANCRLRVGFASVGVDRRDPDLIYPLDDMPRYVCISDVFFVRLTFATYAATLLLRRGSTST